MTAFILNVAILIDLIWHATNLMVHNATLVDTSEIMVKSIKQRFSKHSFAWVGCWVVLGIFNPKS